VRPGVPGDFPIETRFTLEARVGRGASGDVYRALDRVTGQPVAVKRLVHDRGDDDALTRFRREARLLAQIEHPHVVRYVAHGVDADGRACLVVEWLAGEDLSRRLKRAPLVPAEALLVAREIASGLAALHDAGIVHRDVKPANVFLVDDEAGGVRVKLIDLGVARSAGETTLTAAGLSVGTPSYMAPEQARGEERITPRADQFALGVLIFEIVAGKRPFTGPDQFSVLAKILLSEPPRLAEVVPDVPPALDALVSRALRKEPGDRFPSMAELSAVLGLVEPWSRAPGAPPAPPSRSPDEPTARPSYSLSSTFEQRVITALFAGFPVAADEAEKRVFTALVEEQGGVCHGALGRRMIAVFGSTRSTGDEAVRAARAALSVGARLPSVRLAIATGRALSGVTGLSGDLIERGAHGLDDGAGVRLDEATARLLADHFHIEGRVPAGAKELGGADVGPCYLHGPRPAAAAPRTLVGKPTPLCGRDRELGLLTAAFAECVEERVARAVVITGAPGIGKSRLRYELLAHVARADPSAEVLLARGSPLAVDAAFGLLSPLIRRHARILDGEPAATQWAKLAARTGGRLRASTTALLGELAALPFVDPAPARPRRDAMLSGDLMRAAWIEWLAAERAEHPVVLVLEDLHWGDRASVAFVGAALRAPSSAPLLVVALGRPEMVDRFPATWIAEPDVSLRLGPLTARAGERLVRAVLGPDYPATSVQRLLARAEGNAFYLEELVRAAAEGSAEALPDTVLGMVQARLDAFGLETKKVLRAASVFGQVFWRGAVAALLDDARGMVDEALDRLVAAEVVARREASSFPGEDELIFRHALVRDAAYAMIPDDDRRVGHRLAGAWLSRAGEVDPAVLAAHFERGDDRDRACVHHLAAAEMALAGNDFAAGAEHAERALTAGARGEDRGRAYLIQAEAHRWRGEMTLAAPAAASATDLLPPGSPLWFHAVREAIAANGRLGRFELVSRWADAAIAADSADPGPRLAALAPAAGQLIYAGDLEKATRVLVEIERAAATAGKLDPGVAARLQQVRAILADHEHDMEAALSHHEAALDCFERAGDRRGACLTLANIGHFTTVLGAFDEAEAALRRAHETATMMGLGTIAPLALHNLGVALGSLGRLAEARAAEEDAAHAFALAGDPRLESTARTSLARTLLASGDAAAAEIEARRAAEIKGAPPPARAGARAAQARALLALRRVPEAVAAAAEAAEALAALGSVEESETLIGLALAETRFAAGDPEAARAAIGEAARRVLARAQRLREPARTRFLTRVPDNARCLDLARAWGVIPG
jgi:tRNA A-37 threonylcarbamoyl transferase component Bud32